ncbi:MAG: Hydroxyacylglutathione hydrolase [Microgenomates bacterium OLB22]|nr:MAG: Hydroxyacylglutathione hydrolase [Microgenomates bacterium OLB22]
MDGIRGNFLRVYLVCIICVFWTLRTIHHFWLSQLPISIRFCDVGQGDGAHVRIVPDIDILIDTGPDEKILECLGKGMSASDREIELVLLTHFQKDHTGGLKAILKRYKIAQIILPPYSDSKRKIEDILADISGETQVLILKANDVLIYPNVRFAILWPKSTLPMKVSRLESVTLTSEDLNERSYVVLMSVDDTNVLFTGDTHGDILDRLRNSTCHDGPCLPYMISILKVPHHGAKNGVSRSFYDQTSISMAVVSAGKDNTFGHPSRLLIDTLDAHKIVTLVTRDIGDIWISISKDGHWEYQPRSAFLKMLD